jgi:superfamily II DNA or RNA helicase
MVYIDNKLTITNPSKETMDWIKQNLEFANPEFAKKEKMGLYTKNIPPVITLFETAGNAVTIPYGCVTMSIPGIKEQELKFAKPASDVQLNYNSRINLFSYQERAVEQALQSSSGVIVMPCGSGKTQTALELVARYKGRALWITHTKELLKQSMERAKSVYGINAKDIGTITEGKIDIGEYITFATVQTLASIDLYDYRDYWDVIIVDECHKAVGTPTHLMMFYKVISQLSAYHKFGLTATPKRPDGLERSMFALLGDLIIEIDQENIPTAPTYVWPVQTGCELDLTNMVNTDGTLNFVKVTNALCEDPARNMLIAQVINQLNDTCLILSDRVDHLYALQKLVGEQYTEVISSRSMNKKEKERREAAIDRLRRKEIKCLFATYQLAKEGLDIPSLAYVLFTTPKKDDITVIQSAGRVRRTAPGKNYGMIVDFVDNMPLAQRYFQHRKSIFKKLNIKML